MKDVISVDKVIVNYRIKCDIDLSDREELLISQEEYEEAIQFNLNRSKKNLHSLLISKLPEKKPTNSAFEERRLSTPESVQNSAYNSAISDMYSTLNELFGVQK